MENLGGPPALLEETRGMLGIAATQSTHLDGTAPTAEVLIYAQ